MTFSHLFSNNTPPQSDNSADNPNNKPLDCITVGRANVDCYPDEGAPLDQARTYHVYVGGSPANIAAGISRHGLNAGIITRVANDKHGHFVRNYLSSMFGVDVSQVQLDTQGNNTSLAFAECRPDATTIMYRHNVADLWLDPSSISEKYIALSKSIFISGTALTISPSREAVMKTIEYAKANKVVCAMDIDFRPYGWASMEEAAEVMSVAAQCCDIIIGTRDEFEVSGVPVSMTDEACARAFLDNKAHIVIVKHGAKGSQCFYKDDQDISSIEGRVYPVDIKKPYGAGDAFASTFLSAIIKGTHIDHALNMAAAAASINISGTSCTEAMPTEQEITEFLAQYP